MPEIIPIRDLRDTTKISEKCNSINEPIYITKNGYGDMVIMSIKTYEQYFNAISVYNKIQEGEKQLAEGKVVDGLKAMQSIKNKYGI